MSIKSNKGIEQIMTDKDQQLKDLQEELRNKQVEIHKLESELQALRNDNAEMEYELGVATKRADSAEKNYRTIEDAFFWKVTKPIRLAVDTIKGLDRATSVVHMTTKVAASLKDYGLAVTLIKVKNRLTNIPSYKKWVKIHAVSDAELEMQRNTAFDREIIFSIVVPLYNTPENFLREMIDSVRNQTYSKWELCMADGSDDDHSYIEEICNSYANRDKRIKYQKLHENLGIAGNTNTCLEMATGDFIALFDHDDILHPSALYEMMTVICNKKADFVYTDELVFISPNLNNIKTIHFKPDFAPDTLKSNNYICHFTAFKKALLEKTGGFRSECDGSQDHDLILRLTEQAHSIEHIPKVLYYWRAHPKSVAMSNNAKGYASAGGKRAVLDSVERMGYSGRILSTRTVDSIYKINYNLIDTPKISIIISKYDTHENLRRCIDSIEEKSIYKNYEIIIVNYNSTQAETKSFFDEVKKSYKNIIVLSWEGDVNYSTVNNYAVREIISGDYTLLLDGSTEIITSTWIEELLMFAQRQDVGATGPILYYPNNTVYKAGLILGKGEIASVAFHGLPSEDVGYMGRMCYAQNLSAVPAECMLIRRDVWTRVGGMNEAFAADLYDLDFCLRLRKEGLLIVWTPFSELKYYGEKKIINNQPLHSPNNASNQEKNTFKTLWADAITEGDPYYNKNFTLDVNSRDFTLQ